MRKRERFTTKPGSALVKLVEGNLLIRIVQRSGAGGTEAAVQRSAEEAVALVDVMAEFRNPDWQHFQL